MNDGRHRWGQLAYTSASAGYGVYAASLDLSPAESAALVSGVDAGRTTFGDDVPVFPSAEQVAKFERNMVWRGLSGLGRGLWHSAPAGHDRSGRAGNCYVHALLQRDGGEAERRPIELWRSPDLLAPFGPDAVDASALPAFPLASGPITRDLVCDFLLDPEHWRLGTLSRLLAALALPSEHPVVLGVASSNDGALWIAAVSFFLSPAAAQNFTFAVWEHPASVQGGREPQVELLCLAEKDLDVVANRPGWVILRDSEEAAPLDWTAGAAVGVAWGNLALQLFSLSVEPSVVLAEIDALSARVGDNNLERPWPLAMVMASRLAQWETLRPMLADVLIPGSPEQIRDFPVEFALTVEIVESALEESIDGLLARIKSLDRAPLLDVVRRVYVQRAVVDHVWLTAATAPGRSAPSAWIPGSQDSEVQHLREAIAYATQETDPVDRAVLLLRLADFLGQEGWSKTRTCEELVLDLDIALEKYVAPLLLSESAEIIVARVGPLSDIGLTAVIWEPLRNLTRDMQVAGAALGRRLTLPVIQWLVPLNQVLVVTPEGENPLLLEATVAHLRDMAHHVQLDRQAEVGSDEECELRRVQHQVVRIVLAWGSEDCPAREAIRAATEAMPLPPADVFDLQTANAPVLPASIVACALVSPADGLGSSDHIRVFDGVHRGRIEPSREGDDLFEAVDSIARVRRPALGCRTIIDARLRADHILRAAAEVQRIAGQDLPYGIAGTWLAKAIAPALAVSVHPGSSTLWGRRGMTAPGMAYPELNGDFLRTRVNEISRLSGDPVDLIDHLMMLAVQGMPHFPVMLPEARFLASFIDPSGEPTLDAFLRRRSQIVSRDDLEEDREQLLASLEHRYPESDAKAMGRRWCADVIGTGNFKNKVLGVTSKLRSRGRGGRGASREAPPYLDDRTDDQ